MPHLSTPASILKHARRGVLLLAFVAPGPVAWGQSFGPVNTYGTGAYSTPEALAIGDVNGDGRADIVSANDSSGDIGVLLGQPTGFAPVITYPIGMYPSPFSVALGDVNNDGRVDVVTALLGTGQVGVLLGQAGGFAPVALYSVGAQTAPTAAVLGDVNGDGRLDIVSANQGTSVGILLGQAGGFAPVITYSTGPTTSPYDVALGDLNNDGRLDIVTANRSGNNVSVLMAKASGGFLPVASYATGNASVNEAVAIGDINADGQPDIVTADEDLNEVHVLLRQGSGFAPVMSYAIGSYNVGDVALADVNGDGRLDIIASIALPTGGTGVGILLKQPTGFAAPATFQTGPSSGTIVGLVAGDVNADGRPDIVIAHNALNAVGVLLNTGTYSPLATARPTAADLTLAPNPAHDGFVVTLPAALAPTRAALLNSLGQVVRRPAVGAASIFRVETAGLAPGLYTLRLWAGGTALARRVVVE